MKTIRLRIFNTVVYINIWTLAEDEENRKRGAALLGELEQTRHNLDLILALLASSRNGWTYIQ